MGPNIIERSRLAWKAALGVFSDESLTQAYGLLSGIFPGKRGEPPKRGTAEFLKAYSEMPWLRAAVSKIATSVASVPWKLMVESGSRNGKREIVHNRLLQKADYDSRRKMLRSLAKQDKLREITDHPLLGLLESANGFMIGFSARKLTQIYLDLVGEAFWVKERDGLGVPVAMWPLPPHWIASTPTPARRTFEVKFRGWAGEIPDAEVVWFMDPDPANPFGRGSGVAQSLSDELEIDEYSAKHIKTWFYNRARPELIITAKGLKREDTLRLEQDWLNQHQGFWRAYKPHFMNTEVEIHELEQNFNNMQLAELRRHERDTIIQVTGMPPELLGVLSSSNRATIDAATYLFSRWVVVPRLEFIRLTLQERLVPEYDERLVLEYESPVEEDREFIKNVASAASWSRSLDEWRELQGLEELPEKNGKVHMVPLGQIATPPDELAFPIEPDPEPEPGASPPEAPPAAPAPEAPAEEEESFSEFVARVSAKGNDASDDERQFTPASVKQLYSKSVAAPREKGEVDALVMIHRIAARMQPQMRRAFLTAVGSARQRLTAEAIEVALATGNVDLVMQAIPVDAFEEAFGQNGRAALRRTFSAAGVAVAEILQREGIAASFDLTNPLAVKWLREHGALMVGQVTERTRDAIKLAVERSFIQGIPPAQAAKEIERIVGLTESQARSVERFAERLAEQGVDPDALERRVDAFARAQLRARAVGIARTETINGANGGQQALWDEAVEEGLLDYGETRKVWIVTDDDRLDEVVCEPMDGQEVEIDEPFETGDGRRVMHPAAHPECRCSMRLRFAR